MGRYVVLSTSPAATVTTLRNRIVSLAAAAVVVASVRRSTTSPQRAATQAMGQATRQVSKRMQATQAPTSALQIFLNRLRPRRAIMVIMSIIKPDS